MVTLGEVKDFTNQISLLERDCPLCSVYFDDLKRDIVSKFWVCVVQEGLPDISAGTLSAMLINLKIKADFDNRIWRNGVSLLELLVNGYSKEEHSRGHTIMVDSHDLWSVESLNEETLKDVTETVEILKKIYSVYDSIFGRSSGEDSSGGEEDGIEEQEE